MNISYPDHYKWCKEQYKDLPTTYQPILTDESLHELTIQTGHNDDPRIGQMSFDASKKFNKSNDKNNFAVFINDIWDIRHVEGIATDIIEILEVELFRSYAYVDHLHFYRTIESKAKRESSWIWHWDNNPAEQIKLMLYLNDVTEDNAPFQYLRHKDTKKALKMKTTRTGANSWHPQTSRIPDIKSYLNKGYEIVSVTGNQGKYILFDNNILHRGISAIKGHRDAVIFNMRPCHFKIRPAANPKYTGTWKHQDPVRDPMQYKPVS